MITLTKDHICRLNEICVKHRVKNLFLFGSAAKDTYQPGRSDLDFVVEFKDSLELLDYAHNYLSLAQELESLFHSKVDLLWLTALKNPVMIQEIESSKVKLYAA